MFRSSILCLAAVALLSCASQPKQLPPEADPANPDAPQSRPIEVSDALSETQPVPREEAPPAHAGHGAHVSGAAQGTVDAGATVYTCPMHPEVRSDKPGRCPKCGMKLVPESPTRPDAGPSSGHQNHGEHP